MPFERILLRNVDVPNSEKIGTYLERGGYQALRKALQEYTPDELIEIVKASKLRGRGGAGFPAGLKWGFMPKGDVTKYVCVNTDEGEPGTFKDRLLVERDPHQVIEGTIIASYAVGAHRAFVYIRGEFFMGVKRWIKAIADAYDHGFLGKNILGSGFDLDLSVHRGAGAYICGEETAMLNSLEGKRGEPRLKPPFPAQVGLYGQPTLVHNVETLANVPHIVLRGPEWYASIGTEQSTGPKIFCISGHVKRRGNYELPLGTPLRKIIFEHAGGMRDDRPLKAVIPGGASTPVLTPEYLDITMDFESLAKAGSMLGTGAIIVLDESTCMVDVARRLTKFFAHESCGRCTPCRVGTQRMLEILNRIEYGQGQEGDIDLLLSLCEGIAGRTFCPMGDAAVNPTLSTIKHFRDEYEYHIKHKRCPAA
ncbi:MAG: NADH-quinone oxidoreductase subunit NuoF [Anaerolineae bacterium]|jgi:NADH-quinone oxidoreductase subunit F|nr:NADH-quinone oxidoreductase subunit NuoF [Anaerolineae bacterium]MDH7472546.1 NADH-quinone oxidoreductase subunit NuoF [Anaerolineae bacterium]